MLRKFDEIVTQPDLNISLVELDIPDVKSNQYPIYTDEEMERAYDLYAHVVFKVGEEDYTTNADLPIFDVGCLSNEEYNNHLADLGILVYYGYEEDYITDADLLLTDDAAEEQAQYEYLLEHGIIGPAK